MTEPRPLRVAHLTTVDMSLRLLLLPQLLGAKAHGADVAGISGRGPYVDELEALGVEHIPLEGSTRGMNVAGDLTAVRRLWRILRRRRFDVLHTHNPKPGIYGRIVGRAAGVPIVVNTLHGLYATETDPLVKRAVVYSLEVIAALLSDAELLQNEEDLQLLRRLPFYPRRRAKLLGNGIDLDRFDAGRDVAARQDVRIELGIPDDAVVVGTVGRLVLEKGYAEFLEAATHLSDRFVFVVVGPEDPEKADAVPASMLDQARRSGVRFLGMRRDVERVLAALDIFVLASHREGYPRAAMEAAAMGLPVVATDIRGCRQVVDHGRTGILVPPRDANALTCAISSIGENPAGRRAMALAARTRAEHHFDERVIVSTVLETYRDLASSKKLPAAQLAD